MAVSEVKSQLAPRPVTLAAFAAALTLAIVSAFACAGGGDGSGKLRVVATTTQIGDFARKVGGDRIALTVLLMPNQDAHDFAPQPSQVKDLAQAGVVLRNGVGLDDFVSKALGSAPKASVVIVSAGVQLRAASDAGEASGSDPHVWFSVANARKMVESVRDALADADPAGAAYYRDNAARYLALLDDLLKRIASDVARVPPACRKLVTDHDVFGYYAAAYGLQVVGSVIPSLSTNAQPSAADVAEIVRRIRQENIPAIFSEASANPALINQVAREAGVKVVSDLYADSLGPKGSAGDTYIKMMESNTRTIVEALKDCKQ